MAILHGKLANVYWDSQGTDTELQHCQSWTLDVTHDIAETTSMQDTWKTYYTGFQDWTATVTCLKPLGGTDTPVETDGTPFSLGDSTAARLELYLKYDTGVYTVIYGNGFVDGIDISAPVDGVSTVIYTFKGSGQMQWATGAARP